MTTGALRPIVRFLSRLTLLLALIPSSVMAQRATAGYRSGTIAFSGCNPKAGDRAPLIVFALRGAISTIRADGRQFCHLTAYAALSPAASPSGYWITVGAASDPQPSPTGRQIAYLTTTSSNSHNVWIVPATGSSAGPRRITAVSRTVDRETPSWSPGGRYLAYHEGNPVGKGPPTSYAGLSVLIRRVDGRRSTLATRIRFALRGSPNAFVFGQGPTISWTPDGRKIAAIVGIVRGPTWPVALKVGIADVYTGRTHTVTIRFPNGMLGKDRGRGSYPVGSNLAWTVDSRHLMISTFGRGAGGSLTGLWRVPAGGGVAHLFVGTPVDVQEHDPASPQVNGATGFLSSPNHRLLVTDPGNRFWVADATGEHGRFVSTDVSKGCVLAQYSWLPDNSGLAYVTECTVPGTGQLHLSLYSVSLEARPRLLLRVVSKEPDAVDLAPAQRCVACG
jgi:hypothetical protein